MGGELRGVIDQYRAATLALEAAHEDSEAGADKPEQFRRGAGVVLDLRMSDDVSVSSDGVSVLSRRERGNCHGGFTCEAVARPAAPIGTRAGSETAAQHGLKKLRVREGGGGWCLNGAACLGRERTGGPRGKDAAA